MSTPLFLFEDHCESYLHWKDAGLKDLCVVHVDAHLDVSEGGINAEVLERMKECKNAKELEEFRKNEDILWGGFHPGNYLYPAMMDGTVSKLIWVIPDFLPNNSEMLYWAREHLMDWVELSLEDYDSFKYEGKKIVGKLVGFDFEICFIKDLKCDSENLVWDIDTDFLIDEDDVAWISPMDLVDEMNKRAPNPKMITIAYSVNGGYLSPEQKYLGDLIKMQIEDDVTNGVKEDYNKILEGDKCFVKKEYDKALALYEEAGDNSFFENNINLRLSNIYKIMGDNKQADEYRYKVDAGKKELLLPPYDIAMIHFRRKEYDEALEILDKTKDKDELHFLMSHFISGVINIRKDEFKESVKHWKDIVKSDYFAAWEQSIRAHITFLGGATMLRAGLLKEALDMLSFSIKLNPEYFRTFFHRGKVYLEMGSLEKAARDFRKYLYLRPGIIEALEVHLLLAEVYKRQGKEGMEKREVRKVLKKDTTGFYAMKARLGKYL